MELALLVVALAVVGLALFALQVSGAGVAQATSMRTWGGLAGLALVVHLVLRRVARAADPLLLPIVVVLNGLGLVMIERLDAEAASRARVVGRAVARPDAPLQLIWTALGVGCFLAVVLLVRDHTRTSRYTFTAAAVGLFLLIMPALPVIGTTINGARLWLRVGPFTVQPAELAKIVLIVFFASYLARTRDVLSLAGRRLGPLDLPRGRDLGPLLLAWGGSLAVLTVEHDLGLSVLFFGAFVAMLYLATGRIGWVLTALLLAVAGLLASFQFVHNVHNRIEVWLHPMRDALGAGYQPLQAKFALGTGGLGGTGLGQGSPGLVPFANTDFMVSSLGEELGLVGLMAIVVLFAVLVERGFVTALSCRDSYGKLLAAGLSTVLALQVFFIVGGVTGLIPLTGVTLPWLSYGGSSVLSNWALIGLLVVCLRNDPAGRGGRPLVVPGTTALALSLTVTQWAESRHRPTAPPLRRQTTSPDQRRQPPTTTCHHQPAAAPPRPRRRRYPNRPPTTLNRSGYCAVGRRGSRRPAPPA